MQTMEPLSNSLRLQDRHRLVECSRLQSQKQWNRYRLQIADAVRRFHWRTGQHAIGPRLLSQIFHKRRREFFKLVDVLRLATQAERQLARLFEVAIVNF